MVKQLSAAITGTSLKPQKAEVYKQIEDITRVITSRLIMVSGDERGRITQGGARAIFGKIYLYDNKS